jgi:RNA polymerase sigma factor (sigma-70 family)
VDRALEQVKKDIEKFNATGKLPQAHDVVQAGQGGARDYWDWVDRVTGGYEPLWNSGDSELATDEMTLSTNNGERFKEWLREELPKLPEMDREMFSRAFVQGLTQAALATYFRVDQATVSRRLERIKEDIREYLKM